AAGHALRSARSAGSAITVSPSQFGPRTMMWLISPGAAISGGTPRSPDGSSPGLVPRAVAGPRAPGRLLPHIDPRGDPRLDGQHPEGNLRRGQAAKAHRVLLRGDQPFGTHGHRLAREAHHVVGDVPVMVGELDETGGADTRGGQRVGEPL